MVYMSRYSYVDKQHVNNLQENIYFTLNSCKIDRASIAENMILNISPTNVPARHQ